VGESLAGFASPIPENGIYKKIAFGSICLSGEIVWSGSFRSIKNSNMKLSWILPNN
tara:strand:- start:804 stop:971 length:168 start_codon:yes stop_codon:yes gene_type:complete